MRTELPRYLRWFSRSRNRLPLEAFLLSYSFWTVIFDGWEVTDWVTVALSAGLVGTEIFIQINRARMRELRRRQDEILDDMEQMTIYMAIAHFRLKESDE